MHMMMQSMETRGSDNVLILGDTKGWIATLRKEGFKVYGFADHEMWQLYYGQVNSYGEIPWRSQAFKIIVCLVDLHRDVLFEVDRLLIPEGFVLIKVPDVYHSHFSYELFLDYLHYHRYGMLFKTMVVWRKHKGWNYLKESA